MTDLLSWDKPKRLRPAAEHNAMYQSDANIAGTYVPNMSDNDAAKWRAKHIGGDDPRVEVRTRRRPWTQIVIVVRPTEMKISMNGPILVPHDFVLELAQVVREARFKLLGTVSL